MARCSTLSRFLHKFFLEGLRLHKSPQEQGLGANQKKKLKSFGVPELTSLPGEKKKQRDWRLMTAWRFALPRHILHRQLCLCLEAFEDIKPGKTNDTPSTLLAPCGFKMVYGLSIYIYFFFLMYFLAFYLWIRGVASKHWKASWTYSNDELFYSFWALWPFRFLLRLGDIWTLKVRKAVAICLRIDVCYAATEQSPICPANFYH